LAVLAGAKGKERGRESGGKQVLWIEKAVGATPSSAQWASYQSNRLIIKAFI